MLLTAQEQWSPTDALDIGMLLKVNELRGVVIQRQRHANPIIRSVILVLIVNALIMAIVSRKMGRNPIVGLLC